MDDRKTKESIQRWKGMGGMDGIEYQIYTAPKILFFFLKKSLCIRTKEACFTRKDESKELKQEEKTIQHFFFLLF